jgi:hypothetical protein
MPGPRRTSAPRAPQASRTRGAAARDRRGVARAPARPPAPRAGAQVLGWLQPTLTRSFMALAFHEDTRRTRPDLIAREAAYSNANPPHMFRAFYRQVTFM